MNSVLTMIAGLGLFLFAMQLVLFLEQEFQFKVEDDDLDRILGLSVRAKQQRDAEDSVSTAARTHDEMEASAS